MFPKLMQPLKIVYLAGFLFSVHTAFTTYINSSFLSKGCNCEVPGTTIGLLYTIGSVLALIGLLIVPMVVRKFGNKKTFLLLVLFDLIALAGLLIFESPLGLAIFFIAYLAINTLVYFSLDIFVESYSQDRTTGKIRGIFLTINNFAWMLSPFFAGFIMQAHNGFYIIYMIGFLMTMLVLALFLTRMKHFTDAPYLRTSPLETIRRFWHEKSLRKIFMSNFILQFFYAWMVIYMPIYLNQYIGLGWDKIGLIFLIMLAPFVLFEAPLGKWADKKWGEKEILTMGFAFMGITTALLTFVKTDVWWVWALVLFMTRVGASAVEIMTESYFFKHIEDRDANFIGFFRDGAPLAYVIAPILATFFLFVLEIQFNFLFIILGAIVLFGIFFSARLKDTR